MAARGFIRKDFPDGGSGRFRARWVKEPHDAYDETVPANDVIFDSDAFANLPIMDAGVSDIYSVPNPGGGNSPQWPETWIKTWSPALPFVPLCDFQFRVQTSSSPNVWWFPYLPVQAGGEMRVTTGGIRFGRANPIFGGASANIHLTIQWVAYAVPAT